MWNHGSGQLQGLCPGRHLLQHALCLLETSVCLTSLLPSPLCHHSSKGRATYAAPRFESDDEKQCGNFTGLKGGAQRKLSTLFTCQAPGRPLLGTLAQCRAELGLFLRLSPPLISHLQVVSRGYTGSLSPTAPEREPVVSELGLEIDSVTLAGTSSVLVSLFTFAQGGEA